MRKSCNDLDLSGPSRLHGERGTPLLLSIQVGPESKRLPFGLNAKWRALQDREDEAGSELDGGFSHDRRSCSLADLDERGALRDERHLDGHLRRCNEIVSYFN